MRVGERSEKNRIDKGDEIDKKRKDHEEITYSKDYKKRYRRWSTTMLNCRTSYRNKKRGLLNSSNSVGNSKISNAAYRQLASMWRRVYEKTEIANKLH
ncbi:Hypothetical predicted protein [Mytilus galloprovincialis]|uniref:Uncharacterized protein n=1 Tax=Mytilus galloprovincialis TaxID=29158 RepID=A0A8B6GAR8_MYTGA|nr:Hypothetical predicted protein [Mytilus galloprovincialis]